MKTEVDFLSENPQGHSVDGECFHCGEPVEESGHTSDGREFCCNGCLMAYQLIRSAGLDFFYDPNKNPDLRRKKIALDNGKFDYLDDVDIASRIIKYEEGPLKQVWLDLPDIHCASCLRVLESLHRFDKGVVKVNVNFERKSAHILFNAEIISLKELVRLLATIGYEPRLTLEEYSEGKKAKGSKDLVYKLGIAGFCFGNIMLLSLPDYLAGSREIEANLGEWFKYLSLILSLPVFFYSSNAFFKPAIAGLKRGYVNMDAPVSLAILATFVRSVVDVLFGFGTGYFDSMSGIVFFMLIGRYLQSRTHSSLSFDRDFRSYFPIAIDTLIKGEFIPKALPELKTGDIVRIRPGEIIPADAIVLEGEGRIDYSFVTGESALIKVKQGEKVYSGGRQTRNLLIIRLSHEVEQSYLTSLWNKETFKQKSKARLERFDRIGRDFTWGVIAVAIIAAIYWAFNEPAKSLDAFTAVLIIACPCALLVTVAYTHGHILGVLSRNNFYLRDSGVLATLAQPGAIVWDKTGTLTSQQKFKTRFHGPPLDQEDKLAIASLSDLSMHPLSRMLVSHLKNGRLIEVSDFEENPGKGISGKCGSNFFLLGSRAFMPFNGLPDEEEKEGSRVYLAKNGEYLGYFEMNHEYRTGILESLKKLKKTARTVILSGDNPSEATYLKSELGSDMEMRFNQLPSEKLKFIGKLKKSHKNTLMIGDGLNDAGALSQSDFGLAVTDQLNNFTPASDGIIQGDQLNRLPDFVTLAKKGQKLIAAVFTYSAIYNLAGIYFAVRAELSPMIAAIIMPLSSISIILITFAGVYYFSKKLKL